VLLAENANLFAEIERKRIENETLKLKIAEEKKKQEAFKAENDSLLAKIGELALEIAEKDEEIAALRAAAALCEGLNESSKVEAEEEKEMFFAAPEQEMASAAVEQEMDLSTAEQAPLDTVTQTVEEVQKPTEIDCEKTEETPKTHKFAENQPKMPIVITAEQRQELTKLCARAIAEVTKAAALCYTKAEELNCGEAENIYSMALGKNETFKIKASKLLEEKGDLDSLILKLEQMTKFAKEDINALI